MAFYEGSSKTSQIELLSHTVAVGDVIRFCRPPEISTWVVTKVDALTVMIKGWQDQSLGERIYTKAGLDVRAWSLVLTGAQRALDKKTIVDGWKAWTTAGEMQYLQKDVQAARDEAARKAAADYIMGGTGGAKGGGKTESLQRALENQIDTDKGKCPASCTPRNPCLGPMCPGRRESGIGYEMWSKRQTGVNSQIEDYPVSEDQLRRYRNCGAVLMSRGELRCARDMACPLFRSK